MKMKNKTSLFKQVLSLQLSYTLIFLPLHAVDLNPDGTTNTSIEKARNNVPIVNIANPNSSGLSHNKFKDYNVGKQGLILNNSMNVSQNTQLAGYIYGNKNLTSNAKVILNEVTSTRRSAINGYTEIAGKRADLIMANPNGITINGAGFINTGAVTFTTGSANILNGKINSFSVNGGDISIQGSGLDTRNVDSTHIYTHYLNLNAQINAKNLDIKLGKNEIDNDTKEVTSSTNSGETTNLLLDASALGGMYANRISLVGTDKGLGVNLPPEVLASAGDITISNDGKIVLQKLSSKNDISVTSLSDDIDVDKNIYSSNDISLNTTNTLNNNSDIKAKNTISITSNHLVNDAHTIIAGVDEDNSLNTTGNLIVTSNTIDTTNSTLHATNDLTLTVDTLDNKDTSKIQAGHDLTINSQGDITNSSEITALNDIDITTKTTLTNDGLINTTNDLTINSNNLTNNMTLFSGNNMNIYTIDTLTNNEYANILAVNNLFIAKNSSNEKTQTIENKSATIQTIDGDITMYSNNLENTVFNEPSIVKSGESKSPSYVYRGYFYNKTVSLGIKKFCTPAGRWCGLHSGDVYSGTLYTSSDVVSQMNESTISSGSNSTFNIDNIVNKYSKIESKNDMAFDTLELKNLDKNLYDHTREVYSIYTNVNGGGYNWGTFTLNTKKITDKISSAITSGGAITGNINKVNNGEITEEQVIVNNTEIPKEFLPDNEKEVSQIDISLPLNDYGLFVKSKDSSTEFLIETNPKFAIKKNFLSSDYFLDKIDFDPTLVTTKRVGDAFYEQKLIRESIFKQTGKSFLDSAVTDANTQYQNLMNNAIQAQKDLELIAGISLTKEQINNLTQDMVWMEEKVVSGQKVLVPVVYISNVDNFRLDGAKIVASKNITLQVDNLVNSGSLDAGESIAINSTDTIENYGGKIQANEDISLLATNDITNTSGDIEANNITLTSTEGDIVNQRYSEDISIRDGGYSEDKMNIAKEGKITAKNNINITAKNNITNQASTLEANNINLNANNINITTLEDKRDFFGDGGTAYTKEKSTTNLVSNLNANNININAINKATIKGSNVNATNNINIKAENVDVLAVNDVSYNERMLSSKGFASKKSTTDMTYKETVVASKLTAKNISINSDKDVTLEAAKLIADENIIVDAKGDINVVAKQYREGESHQTTKSSWGGLKKSASLFKLDNLKLKEAKLQTEALNIVLKSGKDINIIASDINGAADVQLEAFNKLLISAGEEIEQSEQFSKKTSFNIGALLAPGIIDTPIYSQEIDKTKKYDTKIKESNIIAGNNFTANTGSTKVIGSNIEANNDITITSDIDSVEIVSAQEMQNASSLHKKIEVKLNSVFEMASNTLGSGIDALQAATDEDSEESTKIKINVAKASYDKEERSSTATKNISSNLVSKNGNININGSEDVKIKGSNLNAKEDITLTAQTGDVTIEEAVDTKSVDEKSKHASAEVNLTVQNEYVEVATAVKAAKKAAEQLKKVKDDYSNYKTQVKKLDSDLQQLKKGLRAKEVGIDAQDIEDIQEIVDDAKDDERYYLAAVVAATADLASKTVAVAQQIATAAASSGTYGFSAGVSLDLKGSKTTANNQETKAVASNLNANNITIKTNKDIDTKVEVSGSNVNAQKELNIDTKDLVVKASSDTISSTSDTKDISGSVSMTMYGAASGPTVSLGYGEQHYDSDSVTYNNSQLNANNININTSNDATFAGAKVNAQDTLNLNVGNDLNIESKRNINNSNSNGFNLSAGFSIGASDSDAGKNSKGESTVASRKAANQKVGARTGNGNVESANGAYGANTGRTKIKQTVLSSLTGDKVNVTTGSNSNLKGALLAAGSYDENGKFIDNENLKLETKTLTFSNSTDSVYNSSNSFNVGAGIGISDTSTIDVTSSSLAFTNKLGYQRDKTLATLGKGDVTITDTENSDDITSLNRDTENLKKSQANLNYGVEVDATLDHRLLSEEGRKQIAEDFKVASKITDAIKKIVTTKDVGIEDFFSETNFGLAKYEAYKKILVNNPEIVEKLNNSDLPDTEKQIYKNQILQAVNNELGITIAKDVKVISTDIAGQGGKQVSGFITKENSTIISNDKNQNTTKDAMYALGQELGGSYQKSKGIDIATNRDQHNKYQDMVAQDTIDDMTFLSNNYDLGINLNTKNNHNVNTNQVTNTPSVFNSQTSNNNIEFAGLDKEKGDNFAPAIVLGVLALADYLNAPDQKDEIKLGATDAAYLLPLGGSKMIYNGGKTALTTVGNVLSKTNAYVAGGTIAGGIELGTQTYGNLQSNTPYDGEKLLKTSLLGVASGGLTSSVQNFGKGYKFIAETIIDAGTSVASQYQNNGKVEAENVLVDVVIGKALGEIGGKLGENSKTNSPYMKQVDKVIDRQTRLTKNPKQTNPSRIKAKETILNEIVEHKINEITKTSARVGSTTSGVGTAIVNKIVDADDQNDK